MAQSLRPSSIPSEPDASSVYRRLSAWAVVGLIFGLLSFVSLAHPSLWIVALLAVICSAVAIVRIAANSEFLMGRTPACIGLSLGLFFLACAPIKYYSERMFLQKQAQAFVQNWIDAVRNGRLGEAHQATLDPQYRQPENTDLEEFYRNSPEDLKDQQSFFSFGVAKDLVDCGPSLTVKLDDEFTILFDRDGQRMTHQWNAYRSDKPNEKPFVRLKTQSLRTTDVHGEYWHLVGLADADAKKQRK